MAVPLVGPRLYYNTYRSGGSVISWSRNLWDGPQSYRLHIDQVAVPSVSPETYGLVRTHIEYI